VLGAAAPLRIAPDPSTWLSLAMGFDALEAITNLISKHVAAARTRCRALCEQRAELWRSTNGGTSPLAQEARSRANEETCIADL
jgi:hypothetical protein